MHTSDGTLGEHDRTPDVPDELAVPDVPGLPDLPDFPDLNDQTHSARGPLQRHVTGFGDADEAVTGELVHVGVGHRTRRHRRTRPRGTTIAMKRVSLAELELGAAMHPPVEIDRPRTRAECSAEARPCPWVACKHHLYLDINPSTGSIKINFPDREPWELEHSCALDIAEAGGKTLDEIGEITNLTRERIRQLEVRGLLKLRTRRELR